jgi:copper chaperone CopZ
MAASEAAKSIPGISFVDEDMLNASMTIIFDDTKIDLAKIKAAMKKEGFPIEGEPEALK